MRSINFLFGLLFTFLSANGQVEDVLELLVGEGFENVRALESEGDIFITYENNLYRFEAKGLAYILNHLKTLDLSAYGNISFLLRSQDIPMVVATINSSLLADYFDDRIGKYLLVDSIIFSFAIDEFETRFKNTESSNKSFYKMDVPIGLALDYALGDFNDGLMTRTYIDSRVLTTFGAGMDLEFKFRNIVQNDLPGRAISSPIILKLNQSYRLSDNAFLSASLGFLPQNKFGLHTRFRNYLDQERFYIEFLYGITRLGYLDQNWEVVNNRNSDAIWQAIFNYRWNKFDTDVNLTYGTFYAGDLGYKLQLTRQFNEVYFNLFYARTDILSAGSFGSTEEGIIGFSLTVPFGQSKFMKPNRLRVRTEDQFDLLYRYSGYSFSGIDIIQGADIFSDIREFYPEVLRKGLEKHL